MATTWFVQIAGSEFGPMTEGEVYQVVKGGKLREQIYVWTKGMENWKAINSPDELSRILGSSGSPVESSDAQAIPQGDSPIIRMSKRHTRPEAEQRKHSRHILVATVFNIERTGKRVIGVCADMSLQGIQVAYESGWEPRTGQLLALEVRPITISGLTAFYLEGQVMWTNSAEARVGIQIKTLSESDRTKLAQYLATRKPL